MLYYDPLDPACKSQRGAVARGSEVLFQTYFTEGGETSFSAEVCILRFYTDEGEEFSFPMHRGKEGFYAKVRFSRAGLYFYDFRLEDGQFLGRGALRRGEVSYHPLPWQVTVYEEPYAAPDWFEGGVMYQVFPDRFFRAGDRMPKPWQTLRPDWGGQPSFRPNEFGKVLNNDFFGGDLEGIRRKLPYLASLHVTALYLNPIFEAYSNHRYDTGDYTKIDGLLGTEEDFSRLTADAEKYGIRIILDGVFNHTGDDSRYFNKYGRYDSVGAYQSTSSPYADWYSFHRFPDTYDSWWGIETLPALNEGSESYQKFLLGKDGIVRTWLRKGAAGFRLDVADELPDFFVEGIRTALKAEKPDAILLGEVWEDASDKISYGVRRKYFQGRELDSVMNYPLKNAIIHFVRTGETHELRETVCMLLDNYPKTALNCLMNSLSTHDTPRILTVLGGKECSTKEEMARTSLSPEEREIALEKVRMAAVLQFTLPGVPCIYYGDEAGMEGYMDPFCRGCFPWGSADEELTAFFERLGKLRTALEPAVFRSGEYHELYADRHCLVYERREGGRSVIVWCNRSSGEYRLKLRGEYTEYLTGERFAGEGTLPPHSYGILRRA